MRPSDDNPYAPPRASLEPARAPEDLAREEDRRKHIDAEHAVRGLGSLWLLGAALASLFGVGALVGMGLELSGARDLERLLEKLALLAGALGATLALGKVGLSTRRLEAWTWLIGLCLGAVMLLAFPAGTLIGLYYIVLLLSPRGRRVFQPDYAELQRLTPHVRRQTPRSVWIALAVIAGLVALAALIAAAP